MVSRLARCSARLIPFAVMKLSKSNRYLRVAREAETGLFVSAKTSSGIEGIRKPFARDARTGRFTDVRTFSDHWKRRTGAKSAR